jgi:hypothetical protein
VQFTRDGTATRYWHLPSVLLETVPQHGTGSCHLYHWRRYHNTASSAMLSSLLMFLSASLMCLLSWNFSTQDANIMAINWFTDYNLNPLGFIHLQVRVAGSLDREARPTHRLSVTVSDGTFSANCSLTISVVDVNGAAYSGFVTNPRVINGIIAILNYFEEIYYFITLLYASYYFLCLLSC